MTAPLESSETVFKIKPIDPATLKMADSPTHEELLEPYQPVIKLNSSYLGMSTFYYNAALNKIYKIDYCINNGSSFEPVTVEEEMNLRKWNNI